MVRIADSMMSKILRVVSVERGYDPRRFALIAFGGAGPMHACSLAEELEIDEIIIPSHPGMFSALGLLTSDLFHDFSQAYLTKIGNVDETLVESHFQKMEKDGREVLASEGIRSKDMRFLRNVDLRYYGQSYEITIEHPKDTSISDAVKRYHTRHREIYGYDAIDEPVELVSLRLRAVGTIPKPHMIISDSTEKKSSPADTRPVYFHSLNDWIETPIYERGTISLGSRLEGPAIVEQYDSTTVVNPGWRMELGEFGVIFLRRNA